MKVYEQLEHTADLCLRIYGRDLRELFAHAAEAMFAQLATAEPEWPAEEEQVRVEGVDYESLLVNWLNELLYLHETQGRVYCQFDIHNLLPTSLQATIYGQTGTSIHSIIKAATYHDLIIRETGQGHVATVVFDV